MSFFPTSKAELINFLTRVDEVVDRRKGKLPFFSSEKCRALLQEGGTDKLYWSQAAKLEFCEMELCIGIKWQPDMGGGPES